MMVSHLLLSGAFISPFTMWMGGISMYNLIVKLNDMREEIRNVHELANSNINLKIVLWWAGTFLGKRLRNTMSEKFSFYTFNSEWSLLVICQYKGSMPFLPTKRF